METQTQPCKQVEGLYKQPQQRLRLNAILRRNPLKILLNCSYVRFFILKLISNHELHQPVGGILIYWALYSHHDTCRVLQRLHLYLLFIETENGTLSIYIFFFYKRLNMTQRWTLHAYFPSAGTQSQHPAARHRVMGGCKAALSSHSYHHACVHLW